MNLLARIYKYMNWIVNVMQSNERKNKNMTLHTLCIVRIKVVSYFVFSQTLYYNMCG